MLILGMWLVECFLFTGTGVCAHGTVVGLPHLTACHNCERSVCVCVCVCACVHGCGRAWQ